MKVADRIHIVGSGRVGFGLTDDYDCHVYLLDGGDEHALVDARGGCDSPPTRLCASSPPARWPRPPPARAPPALLTHAHADHAAGAAGSPAPAAGPAGARLARGSRVGPSRGGRARRQPGSGASAPGATRPGFAYPACPVEPVSGRRRGGGRRRPADRSAGDAGHAAGHLSFVLRHRRADQSVFCGPAFFCGGRILLQDTWDCSVQDFIRTVERLARYRSTVCSPAT